jgi:hypothetical protein
MCICSSQHQFAILSEGVRPIDMESTLGSLSNINPIDYSNHVVTEASHHGWFHAVGRPAQQNGWF